ncbi:MAG: hypothetical protein Q7R30_05585 [Acidobacteriota bacterium]|nr:hypothetical protein [Acidobacteriota bacterium]
MATRYWWINTYKQVAWLAPAASLFVLLVGPNSSALATQQKPSPTAKTASKAVRVACDSAYAVAAKTPGVSIRRRTGTFRDETLRNPVFGCGLAISGSFARAKSTGDAAVRLREDFSARAWQEMAAYSADGTDGTSFAFRKAGVSCLVRGTWDGGAAGDPTLPALDSYRVAVFCTSPEFPEQR